MAIAVQLPLRAAWAGGVGKSGPEKLVAELRGKGTPNFGEFGNFSLFYAVPLKNTKEQILVGAHSTKGITHAVPMRMTSVHQLSLSADDRFLVVLPNGSAKQPDQGQIVDIRASRVESPILCLKEGNFFPGHFALSPEGNSIFLPESDGLDAGPGFISERTFPALKVIRRFETGGFRPHSVMFNKEGTELIVGHYGKMGKEPGVTGGGISIIERKSGKVISRSSLTNERLSSCHLARDDEGRLFVSSRLMSAFGPGLPLQRPSPVFFGKSDLTGWTEQFPDDIASRLRFNFSICYNPKHKLVAVSHLEGAMVTLWDPATGALKKMIELEGDNPRSLVITPDQEHFVVNTQKSQLVFIEAKGQKIARKFALPECGWTPHFALLPG